MQEITNKTVKAWSQTVAKSNILIQNARFSLTAQQFHLINYCISKIRPTDPFDTWYTFDIKDFCALCRITESEKLSGYYYNSIKNDIKKLTERFWIPDENDKSTEKTISFIGDAKITKSNGTVSFRFHQDIAPYLFELKNNYTSFKLIETMRLKSAYSIRIYELLISWGRYTKSIQNYLIDSYQFEIDILKKLMLSESVETRDFMKRLKKAVNEINEVSEIIKVNLRTYKEGKKIKYVIFETEPLTKKEYIEARQHNRENGFIIPDSEYLVH